VGKKNQKRKNKTKHEEQLRNIPILTSQEMMHPDNNLVSEPIIAGFPFLPSSWAIMFCSSYIAENK